jgi:hypothetical protein
MPLARIITRSPEASNQLARKLRARGFEVESRTGAGSYQPADVEFTIEEYSVEDALDRAAREAGTVFLAPGALVDDLRQMTVIPLMSDLVRNAHTRAEPVPVPAALPSIAAEAAPVQPVVEMHDEAVEVCAAAPIEDSNAPEPFVAACDTLIVADRAAEPAFREPDTADNFVPEFAVLPEIPVLSETLPTLAAMAAAKLEEEIPAPVIQQEVALPEADLLPAEKVLVTPTEVESLPLPVFIPAEAVPEEAPVLQSVVFEPEGPPVPLEQVKIPILVPRAAMRTERKIRIVLPGLKKNFHAWAAAALLFAITTVTVLFVSTKPASQAEKFQNPAPQTSLQTQNAPTQSAPATSTHPDPPKRPASAPTHRTAHASDDGYIAKDTVVRYGSRGAAPGKKPAAQSGDTLNRSSRE